jgi:hypothetical protein
MTDKINIDELRADMDAGTPGPWRAELSYFVHGLWGVFTGPDTCGTIAASSRGDFDETNARRIARLPELEQAYLDAIARAETAEAERDRLQSLQRAGLPGDMHWLADDPEQPLDDWSHPIDNSWEFPGAVFELMAAVSLPNIFVTERVLTVDKNGDPDATEPAWFWTCDAAEDCYADSLAHARAALKGADT